MSAIWLEKTDLANLVGAGVAIDSQLSIGELPRVAAAVLPESGPIEVKFAFENGESGVVLMDGELRGTVYVPCQRCLEAMPIAIEQTMRLALMVSDGGDANSPDGYETLVVPGGELRVADLIEDELLLDLPLSPRHADGDCGPLSRDLEALESPAAEMTTPFAGLADMMRDRH